jgi:hypothetical protein
VLQDTRREKQGEFEEKGKNERKGESVSRSAEDQN